MALIRIARETWPGPLSAKHHVQDPRPSGRTVQTSAESCAARAPVEEEGRRGRRGGAGGSSAGSAFRDPREPQAAVPDRNQRFECVKCSDSRGTPLPSGGCVIFPHACAAVGHSVGPGTECVTRRMCTRTRLGLPRSLAGPAAPFFSPSPSRRARPTAESCMLRHWTLVQITAVR